MMSPGVGIPGARARPPSVIHVEIPENKVARISTSRDLKATWRLRPSLRPLSFCVAVQKGGIGMLDRLDQYTPAQVIPVAMPKPHQAR